MTIFIIKAKSTWEDVPIGRAIEYHAHKENALKRMDELKEKNKDIHPYDNNECLYDFKIEEAEHRRLELQMASFMSPVRLEEVAKKAQYSHLRQPSVDDIIQ